MTEVRIEAVSFDYPGGIRALDGVDLAIGPGERVAIVGQNGSGKTTLVRHLNGLLRPASGRVLFDGADAARRTVAKLAQTVGLAFQDPDAQVFSSSVRAEVSFGPRNLGLRGAALRTAVDEALRSCGLDGQAGTNPGDLGGSNRKLLTIASVLAMQTPVVVLDEPTTGQDLRGIQRVEAIVDEVVAAGRTMIAITHDLRFAAEGFGRIVVMLGGRVILDGPPETVFAPDDWPSLRSAWLEPPLPALVGGRLALGSTPTDGALQDRLEQLRGRRI